MILRKVATVFREQRIKSELSLGQLAQLVGYRNVSKGANRICNFERTGVIKNDHLLVALTEALELDPVTVEELIQREREEQLRQWEAWVNEPVPMQMIVRIIPAIYVRMPLPKRVTTPERAERFACRYAKRKGFCICLAISRRLSVWIDKDGKVYSRSEAKPHQLNVPSM